LIVTTFEAQDNLAARLGCLTNSKPQTHLKPNLTLLLFCLHLGFGADCLAASELTHSRPAEPQGPAIVPGATELSPSRSQYFSWINNRNEGSTEAQTLANLGFFKWLHDEYGMQLDIYAFDAGNIDGPQYYGRMDTDKFKAQFPRGFAPIYELAKSFGCRLGLRGAWMTSARSGAAGNTGEFSPALLLTGNPEANTSPVEDGSEPRSHMSGVCLD